MWRQRIRRFSRLLLYASLAALVASLSPAMATTPRDKATLPAHPWLIEAASQVPNRTTRVIIQATGDLDRVEATVRQLGGQVSRAFPMINAFEAAIPAGAIPTLARHPDVRWITPDAPMVGSGRSTPPGRSPSTDPTDPIIISSGTVSTTSWLPISPYVQAIGAHQVWSAANIRGQGVTVAVVDTGIAKHQDIKSRIVARVNTNANSDSDSDAYGHGTHIAGIIAGDGSLSDGRYVGVAPEANVIAVKAGDSHGYGTMADILAALQWVYDHKDVYGIRVVNMSLSSTVPDSYLTNPLNAAVEVLWFSGIVITVSAGNAGEADIAYPPANDPFVITVGAADDRGTPDPSDDQFASYSAYGITPDGFAKPDLVAPGTKIISLLSSSGSTLAREHPDHLVNSDPYFDMSGTSMASAVTAGAAALLLQAEPNLTPDQVKYRLMATARPFTGPEPGATGAGYLDIYAAVHTPTTESANTGLVPNQLLWPGDAPITWDSVNWGSVNWGSVNWGSVNWGSVNWGSVNWGSVNWGTMDISKAR
ncbi:MAG: hypothetical protein Kow0047_21960 [Anaerolineae bacterium]